jgi:Flp pilus assembly pilin Flp
MGLDFLKEFWARDDAQDIAEYAILLVIILVIVVAVASAVGVNANTIFSKVGGTLKTAGQ